MRNLILPLIPPHKTYVEPYFGGGTLFFSKGPSFMEVINDSNDNVINFYRVMKMSFDLLHSRIQNTLLSDTQHREATHIYRNPHEFDSVTRAWAFWMVTNFSHANKPTGGIKFDTGSDGSHAGRLMVHKKADLYFYKHRLADTHICCRDALDVIQQRDDDDVFFYLDPPYPNADQGHYKGFTMEDFQLLLILLKRIRGKFLLHNYPDPSMDRHVQEAGWHTHTFDLRLSAPRTSGDRKVEMIIMNYEPPKTLFDGS